jgi:multicomponent Na+:H+ antiporter subunit G
MHALTKATTLGLLLVLIGSAFALDHPNDWTSVGLAAALQLLTTPVSAHLIAQATYRSGGLDRRLDVVDELAEAEGRAPVVPARPPVR